MLEKSVVEKCCRGVLEKSAGGDCWRRVVEKSVVEKCCREVLEKSLVEECWGEVLEKSVGEKCCREECCRQVLEKSVVENCCKEVFFFFFFFSRPFFRSERSAQATSLIGRAVSSGRSGPFLAITIVVNQNMHRQMHQSPVVIIKKTVNQKFDSCRQ